MGQRNRYIGREAGAVPGLASNPTSTCLALKQLRTMTIGSVTRFSKTSSTSLGDVARNEEVDQEKDGCDRRLGLRKGVWTWRFNESLSRNTARC